MSSLSEIFHSPRLLIRTAFSSLAIVCLVAITACSDDSDSRPDDGGTEPKPEPTYSVTIERTEFGTAHVTADSWGSLGYGQGYAFAQDRFCVLMDQVVKVRSQRARYFGPGEDGEHVGSDFAYLNLGVIDRAADIFAGMSEEVQEVTRGYVAGFNRYLRDTGADNIPGACAGEPWVGEIDVDSLTAYWLDLVTLAGSRVFIQDIASAAPPGQEAVAAGTMPDEKVIKQVASNGFALGGELTANGKGLLLANPHLPHEDELRFHEVHLTIPGEVNVAGVTLSGVAGVLIGFNDSMAWTHTTSPSNQFIVYTLDLVPGDPTRYYFGDEERAMQAQTYTIEVLQQDGSLAEESHTLYRSHYGPMLDPGRFGLAWTGSSAYTIFDINSENGAFVDSFLSVARAGSVTELREVYQNVGGVPWNHTLATDSNGEVFYADATLVPNLSDEAEAAFQAMVESEDFSFAKIAFSLGLVALDGSDPFYSVEIDERATLPGAIPFAEAPQLVGRRDYVGNSNDSYWLSNPEAPLEGYSIRYGDTDAPRSLRTRMGLTQIAEGTQWDRISLRDMLFANRSFTEELWRDQLVAYCGQFDSATATSGESVGIGAACQVLADWDGRYNLDSAGAILYRETMSNVDQYGLFEGDSYFSEPFDSGLPVTTPGGLTPEGEAYLLRQLADAVIRLEQAGIPLDARLGDYQYILRGEQRFALHGGQQHTDGALNKMEYRLDENLFTGLLPRMPRAPVINGKTDLTEDGYLINFGGSFIMSVEFTEAGPAADALLVYSQSDDPSSPHFSDQTALYSSKTWRPLPFTREQIEADSSLTSMTLEE